MTAANVQTMLGYIRRRPIQSSFLLDMFVKERNVHATKSLVLDQVFGGSEIAPFVSRKSSGHVVGKDGYTSITHVTPYIKEKVIYDEEDADIREPGTTGFDGLASIDALIARNLDELDVRIVGQEERQLAEAIQDGVVTVSGEGVSYTIDFQQLSAHKVELTGANRWPTILAAGTAADLYAAVDANLRTWCQLPMASGSPMPNVLIGDVNTTTLIKTAFASQLDNRRVDYGRIKPELLDRYNATYEGDIWGTGYSLKVFTYQGYYKIDGSSSNYIGDHILVLGNTQAYVSLEYGKISNMQAKANGFRGRRFPNRWMEPDGSAEYVTLESAPMIHLREPRAFVRAHVTAAA